MKIPTYKAKEQLTIQVEAELLAEVREAARKHQVTLREIVEFGLRVYLKELKKQGEK